jgi:hypothetical protein
MRSTEARGPGAVRRLGAARELGAVRDPGGWLG